MAGAGGSRNVTRLRVGLVVAIVLMLGGLVVLGVMFVRALQPAGAPPQARAAALEWVRSFYGFGPAADEQLRDPSSVAFAPNGDVYANDPARARVMRFRPGGAFASLVHTGRGGTGRGQFTRPQSLATDARGDLYIADPVANKVIVFGDDGRFSREWKVDHAVGVQIVGDLVYVSTGGEIHVFDRKGEARGSFGRHGNRRGELDAYQGVEADARHVFVADALNERVVAFDRQGEVVWSIPDVDSARVLAARSATASAEPSGEVPFELPQDLTFDARGRLVVVDAFKFQLVVLDPATGSEIGRYGEYGSGDGAFFYPTGVAYDAKRDWFAVADTRNDRVQIVRIPASGSDPASAVRRTLTSPYRYCLPPVLVALVALILALVTAPRMPIEQDGEESPS